MKHKLIRFILNRLPVKDYSHFYGQGATPVSGKCPLWTDNNMVHDRDVAQGALEARNAFNKDQPGLILKNDPTLGINMANAQAPIEALIRPPPQAVHLPPAQALPPLLRAPVLQHPRIPQPPILPNPQLQNVMGALDRYLDRYQR